MAIRVPVSNNPMQDLADFVGLTPSSPEWQMALDMTQWRKSTNIEDDRQGQMEKLKAAVPPEERGGIYQEDVDDAAKEVGSVEGKRMKPKGGRL